MSNWKIDILYYGSEYAVKNLWTLNVDVGLIIKVPFLGWLLSNGKRRILMDTGVNSASIKQGMLGSNRAEGGESYVKKALSKINISPEEIDTVIYSHFHEDHVGNCHLFTKATHIFQQDEWTEFLDPLPIYANIYYYPAKSVLQNMACCKIDGDVEIFDGLKIYKCPGHTRGSQMLEVKNSSGNYILTGDTVSLYSNLYPTMNEMLNMDGTKIKITSVPDLAVLPLSIAPDIYSWYRSVNKIKALLKNQEFLLPGHEPAILLNKTFFGSE